MSEKSSTLENITVVKLGGTQGVDFTAICQDAAVLLAQGQRLVFVHGGSEQANQLGAALDHPARFITSPSGFTSRYTDPHTLEIFCMAVNGKINTTLVSELQALGVNALGLSGLDGRLITAIRKEAIISIENGRRKVIRDDYSGKINGVNIGLLRLLLENGFTPVVAPLAVGQSGEMLNVDADRAAAMVAAALNSKALVLLTAIPGLMRCFPDETTLIRNLPRARLDEALGYAEGRMKKKVLGAKEALEGIASPNATGKCNKVIIADGRVQNPISQALAEIGTVIT